MPQLDASELKRRLRAEGFEIYRTQPEGIVLAERVRDNLIMDSGVAVQADDGFAIRVVVRAQASHFPGADESAVRTRAQELAEPFEASGYVEQAVSSQRMPDPSEPDQSIDVSHEVALLRHFDSLPEVFEALHLALQHPRATEG